MVSSFEHYVLCDHSSDLRAADYLLQLLLIGFKFCCVHETAPLWLVPQNYSRCLTLYFHFKYKWRTVLFKPRQQLQDQAQITNARSVKYDRQTYSVQPVRFGLCCFPCKKSKMHIDQMMRMPEIL